MSPGDEHRPLAGVRVLDLSRILAGPLCAMVLADLGADVVKVERPEGGDPTRGWGPPFRAGESSYFLCANRGKRSLTLDLAAPDGRQVLERLLDRSDVVIENFLPAAAKRLGLDPASLRRGRAKLVVCSITGYPADSSLAGRGGFDLAIQAGSGLMAITGPAEAEPSKVGVAVSDIQAGLYAATATLAALADVWRGGPGRELRVSLSEAQLAGLANRAADWLVAGVEAERLGNAHPAIVPYESFATADGGIVLAVGTDDQWRRLCAAAGLESLGADERLTTNAGRVEHRGWLVPQLATAIDRRSTAEWVELLERTGVPGGPVRSVVQAFEAHPESVISQTHTLLGAVAGVRSPIAVGDAHPVDERSAPTLGEHTGEVLRELGYDPAEIEELCGGACSCEPRRPRPGDRS